MTKRRMDEACTETAKRKCKAKKAHAARAPKPAGLINVNGNAW